MQFHQNHDISYCIQNIIKIFSLIPLEDSQFPKIASNNDAALYFFDKSDFSTNKSKIRKILLQLQDQDNLHPILIIRNNDEFLSLHTIAFKPKDFIHSLSLSPSRLIMKLLPLNNLSNFDLRLLSLKTCLKPFSFTTHYHQHASKLIQLIQLNWINLKKDTLKIRNILSKQLFLKLTLLLLLQQNKFLQNLNLLQEASLCKLQNISIFRNFLLPLFQTLNISHEKRLKSQKIFSLISHINSPLFEISQWEKDNPQRDLPNDLVFEVLKKIFEEYDFDCLELPIEITLQSLSKLNEVIVTDSIYPQVITNLNTIKKQNLYTLIHFISTNNNISEHDAMNLCLNMENSKQQKYINSKLNYNKIKNQLQNLKFIDPSTNNALNTIVFILTILNLITHLQKKISFNIEIKILHKILSNNIFIATPCNEGLLTIFFQLTFLYLLIAKPENIVPMPCMETNIIKIDFVFNDSSLLTWNLDSSKLLHHNFISKLLNIKKLYKQKPFSNSIEKIIINAHIKRLKKNLALYLLKFSLQENNEKIESIRSLHLKETHDAKLSKPTSLQRAIINKLQKNNQYIQKSMKNYSSVNALQLHLINVLINGGFDIICSSPPAFLLHKLPSETLKKLRSQYTLMNLSPEQHLGIKIMSSSQNYAALVCEQILNIIAKNAIINLILPFNLLKTSTNSKFQHFILKNFTPLLREEIDSYTQALMICMKNQPLTKTLSKKKARTYTQPLQIFLKFEKEY